jgi:short-subunit dehydrogenase
MRNRINSAKLSASLYALRVGQAVTETTQVVTKQIRDHQSEIICIGSTAAIVYVPARVAGFHAGYEFAKSN